MIINIGELREVLPARSSRPSRKWVADIACPLGPTRESSESEARGGAIGWRRWALIRWIGTWLLYAVLSASMPCAAQVVVSSYDFSTAPSPSPLTSTTGTNLDNQDGWDVTVNPSQFNIRHTNSLQSGSVPLSGFDGFDGNFAYLNASGDGRAFRDLGGPLFNASDTMVSLSFVVRATTDGNRLMEFGLADDSNTVGPTFGFFKSSSTSQATWFIRREGSASGALVESAGISGVDGSNQSFFVQFDMDLLAGTGSVSAQNLTGGGVLTPVVGLQNIALNLVTPPTSWDTQYIRLFNNGAMLDNLNVSVTSVPEPSAMLFLGLVGLVAWVRRGSIFR